MKPRRVTLKLVIAFAVLIATLLGVGWLGLSRMALMNHNIQEIVDRRWTKVQLAREALRYSALNSRITMQVFIVDDRKEIDSLLQQRISNAAKVSDLLKKIEQQLESETEKALIATVWTNRAPYVESYKRALSLLLKEGQPDAGRRMMANVVTPNLVAYYKAWENFVAFQGERMDQAGSDAEAYYVSARRTILALLTFAPILACTVAVFVTRGTTKEISQRLQAEQRLREAHEALERRVEQRTAELAKANESLRERDETFHQLADNITDVFWMRSPDMQKVHYVSPGFERIWGLPMESLYSNPQQWINAILPDDRERVRAAFSKLTKDAPSLDLEYRIARPDGEVRWIQVRGFQVRGAAGDLVRLTGIVTDITERKQAEVKLNEVHKQLLETSRQAGMAEVATGVLHNVGNVLNSVNVASTCMADSLRKSKAANLGKVAAMLREHQADLGTFMSNDPKGKQLPGYLAQLAGHLADDQTTALKELAGLQKNIEHIKDIVAMQQSFAKVSGVMEMVQVTDLVEDALRMNSTSLCRHDIHVVKEFESVPAISMEKHKVLQILVNLVRNAKQACDDAALVEKRLTVRVTNGDDRVRIAVSDNGCGIPSENLVRIFGHGFTTKKDGHGFGLHSGALAAREMGGSLLVQSDGLGRGATFTIELPLQPPTLNS